MLRARALDHVGLSVLDMDKALQFYQALGLELLRIVGPKSDGSRIAVLRVGSQELNVFCVPDLPRGTREASAGMDHFCLEMEAASADEVIQDLRKAGIEVASGPVARREGASVFVCDPDGAHVELLVKNKDLATR
jgi:catechol 2,3-dioxygenase-like lactoylglutathione lyase family enzyme